MCIRDRDVMLPGEDGFSILKKLRAAPSLRRLPIIMITAQSSELDTVRGLDCGADGVSYTHLDVYKRQLLDSLLSAELGRCLRRSHKGKDALHVIAALDVNKVHAEMCIRDR